MRKGLLLGLLTILAISCFSPNEASAKFFKAYTVNSSEYPKVAMRYIARNSLGEPVDGLTAGSFRIIQNGVDIPNTGLTLNCSETEEIFPLNLILLTDFTGSMNEGVPGGVTRKDWVLEATRKFLDTLKFGNGTIVNLLPFSTSTLKSSGFKSSKQEILDWMELNMPPFQGLTNLNYPFLNPSENVIDLLKDKPDNMPKVVIMITDGYHEQKTTFEWQTILDLLKENEIMLFTIAVNTQNFSDVTLYDLLDMTTKSGGRAKQVENKADLIKFYNLIAWELQGKRTCRLEWISPDMCASDGPNANVETLLTYAEGVYESVFTFPMPEIGLTNLSLEDNYFILGKNATEAANKLSAKNANFTIGAIEITPANGDLTIENLGNIPLVINKGQEKAFNIKYTPSDKAPTLYKIKFVTTPCETEEITVIAPCGGTALAKAELAETMERLTSQKAFASIFENNTPIEIKGKVVLSGPDATHFNIIAGAGDFTLAPGEKLDIELEFAPSTVGLKKAIIEYNIENAAICGNASTEVEGNAIINSVEDDWAQKGIYVGNIAPNPAINETKLVVSADMPKPISISLQNSNAQKLFDIFGGELAIGSNSYTIFTENLPAGAYFVVITIDGKSIVRKIAVSK